MLNTTIKNLVMQHYIMWNYMEAQFTLKTPLVQVETGKEAVDQETVCITIYQDGW